MTVGIYAIYNVLTDKMYIGSSVAIKRRWSRHRRMLATKTHHSPKLQAAYDKYGQEAFDWQIVEYIDHKDILIEREQFWLDFFKPVYNVALYAERSHLGRKMSAETRQKMSEAHKKRSGRKWSDEEKLIHSIRMTGKKYGRRPYKRVLSAETRAKIGAASKGNKYALGNTPSKEHRDKLSALHKGNKYAAGHIDSPETTVKRSIAARNVWARRKELSI